MTTITISDICCSICTITIKQGDNLQLQFTVFFWPNADNQWEIGWIADNDQIINDSPYTAVIMAICRLHIDDFIATSSV